MIYELDAVWHGEPCYSLININENDFELVRMRLLLQTCRCKQGHFQSLYFSMYKTTTRRQEREHILLQINRLRKACRIWSFVWTECNNFRRLNQKLITKDFYYAKQFSRLRRKRLAWQSIGNLGIKTVIYLYCQILIRLRSNRSNTNKCCWSDFKIHISSLKILGCALHFHLLVCI
jgi:hypothetical protein